MKFVAAQLGVEVNVAWLRASVNAEFNEKKGMLDMNERMMIVSETSCSSFQVSVDTYDSPEVHPVFRRAISRTYQNVCGVLRSKSCKPSSSSFHRRPSERAVKKLFEFFTYFGTHYVQSVTLGKKAGREFILQREDSERDFSSSAMLQAALSMGAFGHISGAAEYASSFTDVKGNQVVKMYDFAVGGNMRMTHADLDGEEGTRGGENIDSTNIWSPETSPVSYTVKKISLMPGLSRKERRQVRELLHYFLVKVLGLQD